MPQIQDDVSSYDAFIVSLECLSVTFYLQASNKNFNFAEPLSKAIKLNHFT